MVGEVSASPEVFTHLVRLDRCGRIWGLCSYLARGSADAERSSKDGMKQNIYDNPDFFSGYKALRDNKAGLNDVLEHPAIRSLLPDLRDKAVLDLGCGAGHFCRHMVSLGASRVVGVDISKKMLSLAANESECDKKISYVNSPIEEFDFGTESYGAVVSSLAFHYLADINSIFQKIYAALESPGYLIFSMEHPLCTCVLGIQPGWHRDEMGNKLFWPVDEYANEGARQSHWFVDGVVKYHRTLATVINGLVDTGFTVQRVLEPYADPESESARVELLEERRRPPFLLIRAAKVDGNHR